MTRLLSTAAVLLAVTLVAPEAGADDAAAQPGLLKMEFLYETASFPQCHASTIVETGAGLVTAWFGGTHEKHPDVGIWVSRQADGQWTAPVEVANGVVDDQTRYPTWNPVLFQPSRGPLLLFYKQGPSPSEWWGMLIRSSDCGVTWSAPERLPDGIAGPIKNKPVELADGTILSGSSTEDDGWRVHMERTPDLGRTWSRTEALNTKEEMGAIQPAVLWFGQTLRIYCRTQQKHVAMSESNDCGLTWSRLTLTDLPNPNSGLDGVSLRDGRGVLVYNHTPKGRSPLNIAVTADGVNWKPVVVLESEPGEYSYPAVIQTSDGLVHATWTWKRTRIRHAVLDPSKW